MHETLLLTCFVYTRRRLAYCVACLPRVSCNEAAALHSALLVVYVGFVCIRWRLAYCVACLPRVSCNEACIPTSTALVCMMLDASTGLPHACEYVRRHACIANTSGICLSMTLHGWLGRLGDTGCCTIHYELRCCLVAIATTILMTAC